MLSDSVVCRSQKDTSIGHEIVHPPETLFCVHLFMKLLTKQQWEAILLKIICACPESLWLETYTRDTRPACPFNKNQLIYIRCSIEMIHVYLYVAWTSRKIPAHSLHACNPLDKIFADETTIFSLCIESKLKRAIWCFCGINYFRVNKNVGAAFQFIFFLGRELMNQAIEIRFGIDQRLESINSSTSVRNDLYNAWWQYVWLHLWCSFQ